MSSNRHRRLGWNSNAYSLLNRLLESLCCSVCYGNLVAQLRKALQHVRAGIRSRLKRSDAEVELPICCVHWEAGRAGFRSNALLRRR